MRFKSLTLKGYIGIYNGLGRDEIFIDFTKCKYNKVIIRGANGSGKSTLLSALSPLPDDNSCFIFNKEARKTIEIIDNGVVYSIVYIHPVKCTVNFEGKEMWTRQTTKGYIYKDVVNLNPNGNISDCKDIIYSIFNLDANFMSLSQLSSEDRGLIDKKPAERKKFVNSILNNLETYNGIYKVLSKKSSIFRSMVNTLSKNIASLGDEDALNATKTSLETQLMELDKHRAENLRQINVADANIGRLDPNGRIQNKYSEIKQSIADMTREIKPIQQNIDRNLAALGIADISDVLSTYEKDKKAKSELELRSSMYESKINETMGLRNSEVQNLDSKIERLSALNSEVTHKNINELISQYNTKIKEIVELFNSIGIDNLDVLTKDEYVIGLNTLKELKSVVDGFRDSFSDEVIRDTIDETILSKAIHNNPGLQIELNKLNKEKIELESKISIAQTLIKTMETLEKRPSNCKIDSCAFISAALEAKKELDSIGELQKELISLNDAINELTDSLAFCNSVMNCNSHLTSIYRYIDSFGIILKKLPNGFIFSDREVFIKRLLSHDNFEDIYALIPYLDIANLIEQYHVYKKDLEALQNERRIYKSKFDLINQIQEDINELNAKVEKMSSDIESWRNERSRINIMISNIVDRESRFEILLSQIKEFNEINTNLVSQTADLGKCEREMSEISGFIATISVLNEENIKINNNINTLNAKLDTIKHSLSSLEDYKRDRDIYLAKYNKVEKIKYYSSPNSGISTVFIDIYMSKIIDMANTLLANFFEGEFKLLPFVISGDEFKIPCMGSGIPNDDVSSMSTGQVCMISMIVSFAMLLQSSTSYNILKLDEIDGGLDTANRLQFLQVLDQLISLLGCEQVIMISHNNEINHSMCDIIQLKTHDSYNVSDGNIIFDVAA